MSLVGQQKASGLILSPHPMLGCARKLKTLPLTIDYCVAPLIKNQSQMIDLSLTFCSFLAFFLFYLTWQIIKN